MIRNICVWGFDKHIEIINELKVRTGCNIIRFGNGGGADYNSDDLLLDNDEARFPNKSCTKDHEEVIDQIFFENFLDMSKTFARFSVYFRDEMTLGDYENKVRIFIRYAYYFIINNEIDAFLCESTPHEQLDFVLYRVAKKLGLFTVIGTNEVLEHAAYFTGIEDHGLFDFAVVQYEPEAIKLPEVKQPWYMAPELIFDDRLEFTYTRFCRELFKHQSPRSFLMDVARIIRHWNLKRDYKKRLNKITVNDLDLTRKYVYFGLHFQPEVTIFPLGGDYSDQLLAIERISEMLPDDVVICVKENPKQSYVMREKLWFDRLSRIDKVQLVPYGTNTYDLINNSIFSATIEGTIGWEAIRLCKPVLIFGYAWYRNFEGVFMYSKELQYDEIADYSIDLDILEADYNYVMQRCIKDYDAARVENSYRDNLQHLVSKSGEKKRVMDVDPEEKKRRYQEYVQRSVDSIVHLLEPRKQ